MEHRDLSARSLVLAHLTITIPIVAIVLLTLRFGLYMLGPYLWPYYISGGLAIGWQWYSLALPRWEKWVRETGTPAQKTEKIAQHSGLVWSDASAIGLFAFHTTAAAICGLHLGPWLVGRWFAWTPLLMGSSPVGFSANYYLEHLELVSFFPALIVGYIASRYFQRLAMWAWLLPAVILLYNLLTFTDPKASVLSFDPWSRFSYYFVIVRLMPTFYNLGLSDPARVAAQMTVVVPFYSGIAYSIGAFIQQHQVMKGIIESFHQDAQPESRSLHSNPPE